jgi:hypothetical protein
VIIAATARAYDLIVITENLKHFVSLGVPVDLPAAFKPEKENEIYPSPLRGQPTCLLPIQAKDRKPAM